jgi:transcription elongation GreA/GreB family factor
MVAFEGINITVITANSPLGQSLMTLSSGDEVVTRISAKKTNYLISDLC